MHEWFQCDFLSNTIVEVKGTLNLAAGSYFVKFDAVAKTFLFRSEILGKLKLSSAPKQKGSVVSSRFNSYSHKHLDLCAEELWRISEFK